MNQEWRTVDLHNNIDDHIKQLPFAGEHRFVSLVERIQSDLEIEGRPMMDELKRLNFEGYADRIAVTTTEPRVVGCPIFSCHQAPESS
jgi:hypothetical protein